MGVGSWEGNWERWGHRDSPQPFIRERGRFSGSPASKGPRSADMGGEGSLCTPEQGGGDED